jgi:hypothetical protein
MALCLSVNALLVGCSETMQNATIQSEQIKNNKKEHSDEEIQRLLKWKTDLSSYVPFHFYTKNPFDGAVCNKFGSENMAIIAIWRPTSNTDKRGMFIIPSHPLSNDEPDIYSYDDGFDLVDWDTLGDAENRDYHDPKIKSKCMAECLGLV